MAERKDYYKILGVTDDERKLQGSDFEKVIKPKYRKIALENHPDKQVGKSEEEKKAAEERFKEASEAYEVLSDEQKRAEYDKPASNFQFSGFGNDDEFHDFVRRHFGDFGGMPNFMNFGFGGGMDEPQVVKGNSIRVKIALTLEEIYFGTTKKFKYKRREVCEHCGGSGVTKDSRKVTCRTCGGNGYIIGGNSFMRIQKTCPNCGGKGHIIENPCNKCNGFGVVIKDFETEVTIPSGITPGAELMMQGLGNAAPHGNGINGDLIVAIYEKPHEKFERHGNDLYFSIEVPVVDAIIGCDKNITTIDGKTLLAKIPELTSDGHSLKFSGYGLPIYGTNMRGDMIGIVKIIMPNKLSNDEKKILKELKKKEHFK